MDNVNIIKVAVLVVVVFLVLGFFGYYFFKNEPVSILSQNIPGNISDESLKILDALSELKKLQLNGEIFSDPAFGSLEDFSKPVDPEPIQRPNPFAPIESDRAPVSSGGFNFLEE